MSSPTDREIAQARYLLRTELRDVTGAIVTIDVIRAFTTAAHAFAAGAREIFLVGTVDEALAFKARFPGVLAMGENAGLRPADDKAEISREVLESSAARRTLELGAEHVHPEDIAYAAQVDVFDFAMEVTETERGLRLLPVRI